MPFYLNGHEITTTASIGIALSASEYNQPEEILRDADLALYQAKALGRMRHEVFNPSMHSCALAHVQLEHDLRRAIAQACTNKLDGSNQNLRELQLHYQPIVALKTNRIVGFEALIRWHHPEQGLIPPSDFIPIAESNSLIIPLGHWVLQEACRQLRVWQDLSSATPLMISVNLSSRQFAQPDLVQQISQILEATGLSAQSLKLEITETVVMENADTATAMLKQLKSLGIQLSIDDFGTGYSSLSYLHQFPIDTLKIDRSFINGIDVDGENLEIVRTIVTLAWNLGMDVIAEGVETNKQLSQVKALQCEYAQGYFFSPAVDADAAWGLLTAGFSKVAAQNHP
jgi:EAL domain-containing protein (putative c-di-GMP-specific phosphodiesterase class I)